MAFTAAGMGILRDKEPMIIRHTTYRASLEFGISYRYRQLGGLSAPSKSEVMF